MDNFLCPKCRGSRGTAEGTCPNCGWRSDATPESPILPKPWSSFRTSAWLGATLCAILLLILGRQYFKPSRPEVVKAPDDRVYLVQNNDIARVVIRDYNWENGVTMTYVIRRRSIVVTDSGKPAQVRSVTLSVDQRKRSDPILRGIDRIYQGRFADERIADGLIMEFDFVLNDGSKITTSINNIRIESYARLTEFVASVIQCDLQYHRQPGRKTLE
jgi:hypothetical protein